jgi:hypothetical protein
MGPGAEGGEAGTGVGTGGEPAPAGQGGTATSGSGGSGSPGAGEGSGGGSGATGDATLELVDDFETPDVYGLFEHGRKPLWYLMDDGTTGVQEPAPLLMSALPDDDQGAPAGSTAALSVACSGYSLWGSGVGIDLLNVSTKKPYDLSPYEGISFWAKVPGEYRIVRVNVPDVGTDPSGELCADDCNDHFGETVVLTDEWRRYEVKFGDLTQMGWGTPRDAFAHDQVYSIHFQIAAAQEVELWLDDLALILP